MKIIKTLQLGHIAVLLLLAGGSAFAATDDTAATAAIKTADLARSTQASAAPNEAVAEVEACHFGMCQDARFTEPKDKTVVGSDVFPGMLSPELMGAKPEPGC